MDLRAHMSTPQGNIHVYYIAINIILLKLKDKSRVTSVQISDDIRRYLHTYLILHTLLEANFF